MTVLRCWTLIGVLLASAPAFAAETFSPDGAKSPIAPNRSILRVAQSHWHFLGCVAGEHPCEHLAHSQGYHHHRIVDEHHGRCHHYPVIYACLGGN